MLGHDSDSILMQLPLGSVALSNDYGEMYSRHYGEGNVPLPDELFTAMHTEFAHFHSASGMRFFNAVLVRQVCVDDLAAVRAVANRWIGVAVIHVRAGLGLHLVFPVY